VGRSRDPGDAPRLEWRHHKTADGAHPDGREQQLLWLTNRARANPRLAGIWLATASIPGIALGREYFGVDAGALEREFAGYAAKPPAAFDDRLHEAALAHCRDLIARDAEDHRGQIERVRAAGFRWRAFRGTALSYGRDVETAHAALAIDWGPGPGGVQAGRGHRAAVMSLDGEYSNVGIAVVEERDPSTRVGPLVITEDFCRADTTVADHFNRFIVGTVWRDLNADGRYQPGEGIGGTRVTPDRGGYFAVTGAAGGYAVPVAAAGAYWVTFSGAASAVRGIDVGAASVLLDLETGEAGRGIE
jgi:hypothetical protein